LNINQRGKEIDRDPKIKKTNGRSSAKKAAKGDRIIKTKRSRETFYIIINNQTDKTMKAGPVYMKI
jgi:hypothetical protein